jgi:hypothetical protein
MSTPVTSKPTNYLDLIAMSTAIIVAYIWLQVPFLQALSLQGFAFAILVFFGLKFFSKFRHQVVPSIASFELVPLVFALLLLIGATNAGQSDYFALLYGFLLLLVLASGLYTAIIVTSELVFVLYAISVQLEVNDWQQLLSLPLMLGFFIYIKHQLAVDSQQKAQLVSSATVLETVAQQKMTLERFVGEFLKPKLATLAKLGSDQQTSKQVLLSQLDLLENEIDKMLSRPEQATPSNPLSREPDQPS